MANLHFHYGTMGSSKSAQLIINVHNFRRNGTVVEVIKPQFDTRFSASKVVSRVGIEVEAQALPNLSNYSPQSGTQVVMVDEVHFFSPSDIDKMVQIADMQGVIVMCYGLMADSNEKIFPASCRLIEVGAKLHRMESNCQIDGCLNLATHHLRFDTAGNVVRAGQQFMLGDTNFKSVCRQCFNQYYHGVVSRGRQK